MLRSCAEMFSLTSSSSLREEGAGGGDSCAVIAMEVRCSEGCVTPDRPDCFADSKSDDPGVGGDGIAEGERDFLDAEGLEREASQVVGSSGAGSTASLAAVFAAPTAVRRPSDAGWRKGFSACPAVVGGGGAEDGAAEKMYSEFATERNAMGSGSSSKRLHGRSWRVGVLPSDRRVVARRDKGM